MFCSLYEARKPYEMPIKNFENYIMKLVIKGFNIYCIVGHRSLCLLYNLN